MDPAASPEPSVAPAVKWLAPPWSVPSGRKPSYRRIYLKFTPLWAVLVAPFGIWPLIQTVRGIDLWSEGPFAVFYSGLAASALAYGLYAIATARNLRLKTVWAFPGLTATPYATVWYGLAFALPVAIEIGVVAFVLVTRSWYSGAESLVWAAWPVMAACMLMARRASNAPVKQTILSGQAPSYLVSTGWPRWWWNGSEWVGFHAAAPEDAVRSPDGNYWWCGTYWVALPRFDAPSRAVAPA